MIKEQKYVPLFQNPTACSKELHTEIGSYEQGKKTALKEHYTRNTNSPDAPLRVQQPQHEDRHPTRVVGKSIKILELVYSYKNSLFLDTHLTHDTHTQVTKD